MSNLGPGVSARAGRFKWDMEHLLDIRDNPHKLGWLLGKDKLTEMHSEWIKHVFLSTEHVSLQAHRGGFKTTAITEVGSIWWLLFNPNDRIALVRKPYTEAAKTLATIRKYFMMEPLQALFAFAHGFPPVMLQKKEQSLVFNFKKSVTKEGSLDAYGIDGQLTGNHYDLIITDDIVVLKDRLSQTERERTKEGVRELLTNVIDPGKHVINVGTPWHPKDAWEVLPPPKKYSVYDTGILSEEQIEDRRKLTTPSLFSANYELVHVTDKDRIFADLGAEGPWQNGIGPVYAHVDAAFHGTHTSALTLMAKLPDGRIQAKGWVFGNVKDKLSWIQEQCAKHRVRKLFMETNADKGYTADLLGSHTGYSRKPVNVESYAESMNKHVKIVTYLRQYWDKIVWDTSTDDEYISQMVDYMERQEPDDAPDSAASLLREAFHPKEAKNRVLWE